MVPMVAVSTMAGLELSVSQTTPITSMIVVSNQHRFSAR